jgi:hypothetical protein
MIRECDFSAFLSELALRSKFHSRSFFFFWLDSLLIHLFFLSSSDLMIPSLFLNPLFSLFSLFSDLLILSQSSLFSLLILF